MLASREKEFPADYNPPARLARVLHLGPGVFAVETVYLTTFFIEADPHPTGVSAVIVPHPPESATTIATSAS